MAGLTRRIACLLIAAGGMALLAGCWGEPKPLATKSPSFQGISLKVAALDDPAILTGVSLLRGEWEASRGGEIAMVEQPVAAQSPLGGGRLDLFGAETRRPG